MDQYHAEKLLAFIYPLIITLSLICSISTAITWNHWKYVLDICGWENNCGCILYAQSSPNNFQGGAVGHCYWAIYGILVPIVVALFLAIYHLFRVCMGKGQTRTATTTVRHKSGDVLMMTSRTELNETSVSPYYWIPAAVLSSIFSVYTLTHAIMFTIGFIRTCNQFRHQLVQLFHAIGNQVAVIQGRLQCTAVYDFMDYLMPDFNYERRREDRINTSIALIIATICTWLVFVLWFGATIINIRMSRVSQKLRV